MPTDLSELQQRFTLPGTLKFDAGEGGLTRAVINTPLASGEVYLHGAHVTRYQPAGAQPVLWMSGKSVYQPDKPIRGGVPICFPWFGPRSGEPASPIHGFARIKEWRVESAEQLAGGGMQIVFALGADEQTRAIWPHAFAARYSVTFGSTLELSLRVSNTGHGPFSFEEAMHTYLAVGDVRQVAVAGLEGTTYIDKTDALRQKPQGDAPVTIAAETDRVYLNTQTTCVLNDPAMRRRVRVAKQGSDTTVVWNPWIAKSKAMADFGDDEWTGMICIETCNAGERRVTLQPGQGHEMAATISTEA